MKRFLCIVLIISSLLGWLPLPVLADREEADLYFKSGTELLQKGETAQAETHFRKALKSYPTHTDSALELGKILAREKDSAKLVKFYTNWIEASKDIESAPKQINILGQITQDPTLLNKLNKLNKRYATQFVSLANSLKDKNTTIAIKACEKALQLNPANAAATNLLERLTRVDEIPEPATGEDALPEGLVGYWKFDKTSGTFAKDSSGNKNHATLHRAKRVTDKTGQTIKFNGRNSYVLISEPGKFNTFSISFWMKTHSTTGILFNRARVDTVNYWWIRMKAGVLEFGIGLDNVDYKIIATKKINDGTWHHIICTRDNATGTLSIYLDGQLNVFATERIGDVSVAPTITIGKWNQSSSGFWSGQIDEVRIFNRVLGTEEIRTNYKKK